METGTKTISKIDDPHYETPLEFAKWRVNELKKPQQSGIINEKIDTVIQLVSGILGQYNRDGGDREFDGISTSSLYQSDWFVKKIGNIRRVIVPFIIYVTLIGVTFGSESNYNTYRLLALLLLYIISYTELKYVWFMIIFLGSIALETTWLLIK
jgi:hypothetical protein